MAKGLSVTQVLLELKYAKQAQVKMEHIYAQAQIRSEWAKYNQVEMKQTQVRLEQDRAEIALAKVLDTQVRKNKKLQSDVIYLTASLLILIIISILLLKIKNQTSFSFTGQLICFLPEECVAELEVLSKQLKSNNYSNWLVKMIVFKCFLELIFAIYIQINIDNFRLPSKKK